MGHEPDLSFTCERRRRMMRSRGPGRQVRVEMRILLLGETGTEPSFRNWRLALERAGVPHDAIALRTRKTPLSFRRDDGQPRFQASIVSAGGLVREVLRGEERRQLEALEREFRIRRLTAYALPAAENGLQAPKWAGPLESVSPRLTSSGAKIFPYLQGPLPVDPGSWGYLADPVSDERFDPLLVADDGSALVGVHRQRDGREEMVQTFDANASQIQAQLLRRGQLAWLTRDRYLGHERNYLPLQVDDVLLPNHGWDSISKTIDVTRGAMMRMTADDAHHAARWSHAHGLRLDLACNGAGSERHTREAGLDADPLLGVLLSMRDDFGWINHTYEHLNLDLAPRAMIEADIARNRVWADRVGIDLEPGALVTGEHSGLANLTAAPARGENPHLAPALSAQGIRYLGCDASRPYPARGQDPDGPRLAPSVPFVVGSATAVPRHPTLLAYAAATREQTLDHLRHMGLTDVSSWPDLLASEAGRIFTTVMSNDPRPHYFHQSNLVASSAAQGPSDGRLLYALLDAVLARYRRYVKPEEPLVQPTLGETGELLRRRMAWRAAREADSVAGYIEGRRVTIVNRTDHPIDVPVSVADVGCVGDGMTSGWTRVSPGETIIDESSPRAGE
jgi:hypothetical protein